MAWLKERVLVLGIVMLMVSMLLGLVIHINMDTELGIAREVAEVRETVVHIARVGEWQGSGCIISEDGIVFTAKHVSGSSWGEFEVTLDDGTKYGVRHIIEDRDNDIAFFQLDIPEGVKLPYAKLAKVDNMHVGDPLFILGSPLGADNFNSVSLGILSGIDRELYERRGWERYQEYDWHVMLQSTSPAFPGNSGGPVFNLDCEVIGVLVASQAETLNFSVPVARFRDTIETVRTMFLMDRFEPIREETGHNITEDEWYAYTGRD